jgi:hypothetical protein
MSFIQSAEEIVEKGFGLSLRLAFLLLLLAYWLYSYIQRRREYQVCQLKSLIELLTRSNDNQVDKAFGDRHGCLPMETKLPYKWPFALDVLKRQYDALPSQRLLAFQSQYFDKMGPNMELMLFGNVGYMTTDPKNIEAILSTRFDGTSLIDNVVYVRKVLMIFSSAFRLRPRFTSRRSFSSPRRRYLYPRWATLEALQRIAATPICAHTVSESESV